VSVGPQPPVDYTSRDWASLYTMMRASAATRMPEWTSNSPNDFGVVLLEAWAYLGDVESFYIDRVANESFLSTATQRSSIIALAALLDYTPAGTQAAKATISLQLPAAASVVIPAGTVITTGFNPDGDPIQFTTDTDVTVTPVVGAADDATQIVLISVTEGELVQDEAVATSCGNANESYALLESPVVDGSIVLSVQESPDGPPLTWSATDHLLDATPGDNYYGYVADADGAITITFGDGVNGRIPPKGSVITATYRVGGGSDGNIADDQLTADQGGGFDDPSTIVDNSTGTVSADQLDIVDSSAATGGTDVESTESIRANAPLSLSTLRRAINLTDFKGLSLKVPTVGKANATCIVYTNVIIYIAPAQGGQPSQSLLSTVVSYMQDKKLPDVTVSASTPTYVPVDITVSAVALPQFTRAAVKTQIQSALADLLAFDNVDFGEHIALSSVFAAVMRTGGIDYATVDVLGKAGANTVSDVFLKPDEIPVSGTITINVTGGTDGVTGGGGNTVVAAPTAPGAAFLDLQRCDMSSSHYEMHWTASEGADNYTVTVTYVKSTGEYPDNIVKTQVFGPFTDSSAVLDVPYVGNADLAPEDRATEVLFIVTAYNSAAPTGVSSSVSNHIYTCEQTPTATLPGAPSAPTITSLTEDDDSSGNIFYDFNASWSNGANTTGAFLVFEILDAGGNNMEAGGSTGTIAGSSFTGLHIGAIPITARAIRFYVGAFNGSQGPVYGPAVVQAISPHGPVSTPPGYTGAPVLDGGGTWTDYTRFSDGHVNGDVNVIGHNIQQYAFYVSFVNSSGHFSPQSSPGYVAGPGPGSSATTTSINVSGFTPPSGFAATQIVVAIVGLNPNGQTISLSASHAY
jgi:Baseplate J-like protein